MEGALATDRRFTWRSAAIVINSAAGSTSAALSRGVVEQIEAALGDGVTCESWCVDASELEASLDRAFAGAPSGVIAIGGDGTIRSAAKRALKTGIPIVPLPGGTMNVLPKLVLGDIALAEAIAALPLMQPRALDVGFVQAEPFFLSAAFGYAGPLTKLREALRPPRTASVVTGALSSTWSALGPSLRGGVRWRREDGRWRRAQTLVVALHTLDRVLNPAGYDDAQARGGEFQIASIRLRTAWDVARTIGYALAADWRNARAVETTYQSSVELDLQARRPLVVLDGEPIRLSQVQHARIEPGALTVLAPPAKARTGP